MSATSAEDMAFSQGLRLAAAINAEGDVHQLNAFTDCFRDVAAGSGAFASIVAENGGQFEYSISTRDLHTLRLLGEAVGYGESIISNIARNYALFKGLSRRFGHCELSSFDKLAKVLFPPGELLNQLQWKFSFYTSIRADGVSRPSFRCYFNLLWGSNEHRILRVMRALDNAGQHLYEEHIGRIHSLWIGWGDVVGISFDFVDGKAVPAKLHLSIRKKSRYRLEILQNWLGLGGRAELMEWFLRAHPGQTTTQIPYLFSVDLCEKGPTALKIDMVLRGLPAVDRIAISRAAMEQCELGQLRSSITVIEREVFRGDAGKAIQYVGVNFHTSKPPYVNFYYSADRPLARASSLSDWKARALSAVRRLQAKSGGFLFESFDFGARHRQFPTDGGDVYMTALVQQFSQRFWPGELKDVSDQCIRFLLTERADDGWRYLPGLPIDIDDTAMALISLRDAGFDVPKNMLSAMLRQQLPSGGFRTFFDLKDDPEHVAVTANAICALWDVDANAASRAESYLRDWLRRPRDEDLRWMYSPLLTMYLLTRNKGLIESEQGACTGDITEIVLARRRDDGLWGNSREESFETALAVLTLWACGRTPRNLQSVLNHLAQSQCDDGTWPWAPMFSDGDGQWFGQRAVSTVICGSALEILEASGSRC